MRPELRRFLDVGFLFFSLFFIVEIVTKGL